MWDGTDLEYGTRLQGELENLLGKVSRARAHCEKFDNNPATAWTISEGLGDQNKALSSQNKVVDDRTDLRKIILQNSQRCKSFSQVIVRFPCVDTAGNLFACAVAYTVNART